MNMRISNVAKILVGTSLLMLTSGMNPVGENTKAPGCSKQIEYNCIRVLRKPQPHNQKDKRTYTSVSDELSRRKDELKKLKEFYKRHEADPRNVALPERFGENFEWVQNRVSALGDWIREFVNRDLTKEINAYKQECKKMKRKDTFGFIVDEDDHGLLAINIKYLLQEVQNNKATIAILQSEIQTLKDGFGFTNPLNNVDVAEPETSVMSKPETKPIAEPTIKIVVEPFVVGGKARVLRDLQEFGKLMVKKGTVLTVKLVEAKKVSVFIEEEGRDFRIPKKYLQPLPAKSDPKVTGKASEL